MVLEDQLDIVRSGNADDVGRLQSIAFDDTPDTTRNRSIAQARQIEINFARIINKEAGLVFSL